MAGYGVGSVSGTKIHKEHLLSDFRLDKDYGTIVLTEKKNK